MGSKSKAPPPPDFTPLIAAAREMSAQQYELQQEQFAWAKQAYADNKVISDQVSSQMLEAQRFNQANAEEDRTRWENQFRPLEDEFVRRAQDYASPERMELERGRAQAGVAQQFDQARDAATRRLESFGIDPTATRYAALDLGMRAQQAAAQAAAGNQAAMATEATGNQMLGSAINLGRQSIGQGLGMQGVANQSGAGAANTALATTASGANTMGTATQYAGLGNQSLNTAGNFMNMGYQNELAAYKTNQESSSGLGSALGLIGGLATKAIPGSSMLGMAMSALADGGTVPAEASPSAGKAVDDIPARLNAGEFVVPKDVASWKGEEFFQKLIDQSRKAKQVAPAKPETVRAIPQAPTFVSRSPSGGALPLR